MIVFPATTDKHRPNKPRITPIIFLPLESNRKNKIPTIIVNNGVNEFKIPAGTKLDSVIEQLVVNSEYYRSQVTPYTVNPKDLKKDKDKIKPSSSNAFKTFKTTSY